MAVDCGRGRGGVTHRSSAPRPRGGLAERRGLPAGSAALPGGGRAGRRGHARAVSPAPQLRLRQRSRADPPRAGRRARVVRQGPCPPRRPPSARGRPAHQRGRRPSAAAADDPARVSSCRDRGLRRRDGRRRRTQLHALARWNRDRHRCGDDRPCARHRRQDHLQRRRRVGSVRDPRRAGGGDGGVPPVPAPRRRAVVASAAAGDSALHDRPRPVRSDDARPDPKPPGSAAGTARPDRSSDRAARRERRRPAVRARDPRRGGDAAAGRARDDGQRR